MGTLGVRQFWLKVPCSISPAAEGEGLQPEPAWPPWRGPWTQEGLSPSSGPRSLQAPHFLPRSAHYQDGVIILTSQGYCEIYRGNRVEVTASTACMGLSFLPVPSVCSLQPCSSEGGEDTHPVLG